MKYAKVRSHNRKLKRKIIRIRTHYRKYKTMQPTAIKNHPPKKGYIYEGKYDGSRQLIYVTPKGIKMINRRNQNTTNRFPEFKDLHKKLRTKNAVIDAEVMIPDRDSPFGDFKKLAMREHLKNPKDILARSKQIPAKLIAFDIIEKEGKNITAMPLVQRKRILNEAVPDGISDIKEIPFSLDFKKVAEQIKKGKGEGVVIKDMNSPYEQKKSNYWKKWKTIKDNDVVILGYSKGAGKREGLFGSLIMGVYDKGKYKYVGNVGTGFNDTELERLTNKMNKLKTNKKPFHLPGDMTWIKPEIIARVNFLKKTERGHYREPRYQGERVDISPDQTHE